MALCFVREANCVRQAWSLGKRVDFCAIMTGAYRCSKRTLGGMFLENFARTTPELPWDRRTWTATHVWQRWKLCETPVLAVNLDSMAWWINQDGFMYNDCVGFMCIYIYSRYRLYNIILEREDVSLFWTWMVEGGNARLKALPHITLNLLFWISFLALLGRVTTHSSGKALGIPG